MAVSRQGERFARHLGVVTLVAILLAVSPFSIQAADIRFPTLIGRVVDDAAVLEQGTVDRLNSMLYGHERRTGNQVVVVTVPSLQGRTIETFGYQLGRHWGIGQAERNNGVLLVVAPKERKVRIEVGYGLEGVLTDALAKTIIEADILPYFRHGSMGKGVLIGTMAILRSLGDSGGGSTEAWPETSRDRLQINPIVAIMIFLFAAALISSLREYRRRKRAGVTRNKKAWFFGTVSVGTGWGNGRDDRGGSVGGSSSGFSGGGGSFGGGGASGGW